jgi:ABC-type glycerol-3-phosphate transport system substrate-binding protein
MPGACAKGSNVQDWNQATNLVITGQAGGQIMGDWAQGEFQVAGQVAGEDYTCLPGLGVNEVSRRAAMRSISPNSMIPKSPQRSLNSRR